MSFAPSNNRNITQSTTNMPKQMPQNQQKQQLNFDSPHLNTSQRSERPVYSSQNFTTVAQRLDLMESNLSRVCNQHDALMPLLNLLEYIPQINKSESSIKTILKNQQNIEGKLQKIESQVNQNQNNHVFGTIERNFKNTNTQITQMKNEIKDISNNLNLIVKQTEAKMKEEANQVYRNVDIKLEKSKRDIQNILAEFKNGITLNLKRNEEIGGHNQHQFARYSENFEDQENSNNQQSMRQYLEKELLNVYREMGMIQSELEVIQERSRKKNILTQMEKIPQNLSTQSRQQLLYKIEQEAYLDDLETFDIDNQERLIFEIDTIESKMEELRKLYKDNPEQAKNEMNYLEERYFNLQQQIHGTKKKYLLDARRVDDRLDILRNYIDHSQITSLQDRVDKINYSIVNNVETLQTKQRIIDDKIANLKQSLK